jgi:hypothetical protein
MKAYSLITVILAAKAAAAPHAHGEFSLISGTIRKVLRKNYREETGVQF